MVVIIIIVSAVCITKSGSSRYTNIYVSVCVYTSIYACKRVRQLASSRITVSHNQTSHAQKASPRRYIHDT